MSPSIDFDKNKRKNQDVEKSNLIEECLLLEYPNKCVRFDV